MKTSALSSQDVYLEEKMISDIASYIPFLICQSGERSCGFPLQHVVETMRALPVEAFPDMQPFMLGIAIIRGATVPVINLAMLLKASVDTETKSSPTTKVSRFITIKTGHRVIAFAVGNVVGVGQFAADDLDNLPKLLGDADTSVVKAIGTLDDGLFLVLEASRVISESAWQDLYARGALL
jgi:purine-binding chemotaxis protein CheW